MTHDWLVAGRVDWNIGNNDRMFTRIQKEHGLQASVTDPINPIFNAQSDQPEYQGQYQWTHSFAGSAVNQFIASGQWYSAVFDNVNRAATLAAFPTLLNFGNGAFQTLGGFFGLGNNLPQGRNVTQYQLSDDYSKTIGVHTLKVGTSATRTSSEVSWKRLTRLRLPLDRGWAPTRRRASSRPNCSSAFRAQHEARTNKKGGLTTRDRPCCVYPHSVSKLPVPRLCASAADGHAPLIARP
jgi:hypothetical protein